MSDDKSNSESEEDINEDDNLKGEELEKEMNRVQASIKRYNDRIANNNKMIKNSNNKDKLEKENDIAKNRIIFYEKRFNQLKEKKIKLDIEITKKEIKKEKKKFNKISKELKEKMNIFNEFINQKGEHYEQYIKRKDSINNYLKNFDFDMNMDELNQKFNKVINIPEVKDTYETLNIMDFVLNNYS